MAKFRKAVNLYRWRDPASKYGNFGDEITVTILDRLFGLTAIPVAMELAELIGAGSILENFWMEQEWRKGQPFASAASPELHVWGSGFMLDDSKMKWPQQVHVHSVRGRLSAERLDMGDVVLGDPGILASALIKLPPKVHGVGLVPHYVDYCSFSTTRELPRNWRAIDPEQPVPDVLADIAASELVVSSSLHGLIAADSFRIPCVWASTDRPLYGNPVYKFLDYQSSRGSDLNMPLSYAELMKLSESALAQLATKPARCINDWQRQIADVFPFK